MHDRGIPEVLAREAVDAADELSLSADGCLEVVVAEPEVKLGVKTNACLHCSP